VTGANYLLETKNARILVDCGLTQGSRYCEQQNFQPFPYDPKGIQAVFISHAHIDHIGRLPMLYKQGFRGEIYSSPPTKDMAEFLLLDSEHILGKEAEREGERPPYTASDVLELMKLWKKRRYHEHVQIGDIDVELFDAGHVLGSTSYRMSAEGKKIVFSGDLGNIDAPLIKESEYISETDYALVESVYGGRIHEDISLRETKLREIIIETIRANGVLMIPAFALERTQQLLFKLNEFIEGGQIPRVPVYVDSPLAIKLTAIYQKYSRDPMYFNNDAIELIRGGDAIFDFPGLHLTLTTEQSKQINDARSPKIIIAGAGMSNGGRILHHERRYLSDPASTILFIGYQAQGSLGRIILDGAEDARIMGEDVSIRCKIREIAGYSAHADQNQLTRWVSAMKTSVKKIFVTQGEEEEAKALATRLGKELSVQAEIPEPGEVVEL